MSYYSPNNLWLDSSSKHQLYDSSSTRLGTRPCLDLLAKVWSLWTFLLSKIKGFNLGESRPQNLVVETSVFVPVVVVTVLHLHLIDKHVGLLVPITSNFWKFIMRIELISFPFSLRDTFLFMVATQHLSQSSWAMIECAKMFSIIDPHLLLVRHHRLTWLAVC